MDFVYRVNREYPLLSQQKIFSLAPLGLPSLNAQITLLTHKPGVCEMNTDKRKQLLTWGEFFGQKHRYSFKVGDVKVDDIMVDTMMNIYSKFDGYISRFEWPSCFHNGLFHPEVCLFNTKGYVRLEQKGGGLEITKPIKTTRQLNAEFKERENVKRIEHLRLTGWTGPVKYSKRGWVMLPTIEEVEKLRIFAIPANAPQSEIDTTLRIRRKDGQLTPHHDPEYWDHVKYRKMQLQ